MVDCIVIGAGLAGISAALTLQANGNSVQVLSAKSVSEKIKKAERIHNYPGLPDITGEAFFEALEGQMQGAGIRITPFQVSGVYPLGDKFIVASQDGQTAEGRTVILALGVQSLKSMQGEEDFLGRGVSYCATCDGFLYKDKCIAVVCVEKSYEEEVKHLASFAKKVYLFPLYKDCALSEENVEILRAMPQAVVGEKRVNGIRLKRGATEEILPVDGIFVLKDGASPSTLVAGLKTEEGHIVTDRTMSTNIAGLYAAGDCTGRPYQYAKAAGEGNIAAFSVQAYCRAQKE